MKARLLVPAFCVIAGFSIYASVVFSLPTVGEGIAFAHRYIILFSTSLKPGSIWAQAEPTLRTRPEAVTIAPGAKTTIEVWGENWDEVYGIEFKIGFNPDVVEVIDADPNRTGIQLEPGQFPDPSTGFVAVNVVNPETGIGRYAMTELNPAPPVSGSGIVVRVTFRGRAEGKTTLTLSDIKLVDLQGVTTTARALNGQITISGALVGSPSGTPESQNPAQLTASPTQTPIDVPTRVNPDQTGPSPGPPELLVPTAPTMGEGTAFAHRSTVTRSAEAPEGTLRPPRPVGGALLQTPLSPGLPRAVSTTPAPSHTAEDARQAATRVHAAGIPTVNTPSSPLSSKSAAHEPVLPSPTPVPTVQASGLSTLVAVGAAFVSLFVAWLWWRKGRS